MFHPQARLNQVCSSDASVQKEKEIKDGIVPTIAWHVHGYEEQAIGSQKDQRHSIECAAPKSRGAHCGKPKYPQYQPHFSAPVPVSMIANM
jgi:hypothetical protein